MSQCRQASDPAAGVSDLSGSAGFTVTHSQGFAPYSACPAAWGRPLDLLFSFRRGSSPFRMFRRLSVYHRNLPLAREISPVPPPFQPPPSVFLTRSLHAPPHLPPYSLHLPPACRFRFSISVPHLHLSDIFIAFTVCILAILLYPVLFTFTPPYPSGGQTQHRVPFWRSLLRPLLRRFDRRFSGLCR